MTLLPVFPEHYKNVMNLSITIYDGETASVLFEKREPPPMPRAQEAVIVPPRTSSKIVAHYVKWPE
jgi:hypothetical protein